jgi:hypothetical protein
MKMSGQLHAPAALATGENETGVHYIEGWVGPRVGLDVTDNKNVSLYRESNSDSSVVQPVT